MVKETNPNEGCENANDVTYTMANVQIPKMISTRNIGITSLTVDHASSSKHSMVRKRIKEMKRCTAKSNRNEASQNVITFTPLMSRSNFAFDDRSLI